MSDIQQGGTFADIFLAAINRYPERTALVDPGGKLNYRELGHAVSRLVQAFGAAGLGRGSAVSLLAPNNNEAVCVIIACFVLGMRFTPLHPLGSDDDHAYTLEDAEIDCLVVDERAFPGSGKHLKSLVPGLASVFSMGPSELATDLLSDASKFEPAPLSITAEPGDISIVIYTGGTTGKPKGIVHRSASLSASVLNMACECEWPEDFRFLAVTPISHAANLMIPLTMLKGGTFIMVKGFSPAAFVEATRVNRATATFMVPTMIYALLDHPGMSSSKLTTMQTILYSAAVISPTRLAEAIEVLGPIFVQSYGQTEAPITISVLRKQDHAAGQENLLHSCGMPTSINRVRLLDDDCIEVPQGEIGEICVRGPLVMEAYWKLPDQTREAMAQGWLHTGDLARQDERGYLYIMDRKKDMIVSGGFNIFPREIEDLLSEIPAISIAAVIGIPSERWGEAVCAVVVCKPGQSVSDEQIVRYVKEKKGSVHAPKQIDFVDSIPLTPLGKPDKKALREQYWEGHERRV
jgi:fatty-acyl-CoA synthase